MKMNKKILLSILIICFSIFTKLNAQILGVDIGPKSSIYIYSKNLSRDDARDLGKFLYDVKYFDDQKRRIVEMLKEKNILTIRFILSKDEIQKRGNEVKKIDQFKKKLIDFYKNKTVKIKLVSEY